MLSRSRRVTGRMFEETMKKGRVIHSPLFILRIMRTDAAEATRIAAVAPVKVAKTSPKRHKARRRMYEAMRVYAKTLAPGHVALLFAKQGALEAEFKDLKQAVGDIFVKAGLLR